MRTPLFYGLVKLHARAELRRQGVSRARLNELMDAATDDVVDLAAAEIVVPVGALGDGALIAAVLKFLKSEQGQQLIAALIKLLLMAI